MTAKRQRFADARDQVLRAVDEVQVQRDREAIEQDRRLDKQGNTQ